MRTVEIPAGAVPLEQYLRTGVPGGAEAWREVRAAIEAAREAAGGTLPKDAAEVVEFCKVAVLLHHLMRRPLLAGEFVGYGVPTDGWGAVVQIPRGAWAQLIIDECGLAHVFAGIADTKEGFGPIIPSRGFLNVHIIAASAVSPEAACRAWLAAEVAAGDRRKPKFSRNGEPNTADSSYYGEAQSKFSVSKRSFSAIWSEITRGHPTWTRPGRRRV